MNSEYWILSSQIVNSHYCHNSHSVKTSDEGTHGSMIDSLGANQSIRYTWIVFVCSVKVRVNKILITHFHRIWVRNNSPAISAHFSSFLIGNEHITNSFHWNQTRACTTVHPYRLYRVGSSSTLYIRYWFPFSSNCIVSARSEQNGCRVIWSTVFYYVLYASEYIAHQMSNMYLRSTLLMDCLQNVFV